MSGRGPIRGFRECLACGRKETEIYDYSHGAVFRWVEGQFVDVESANIKFVFAGAQSSFHGAVDFSSRKQEGVLFVWVTGEPGWEKIAQYRSPQIILADDWRESEATHDYRFKLLVEVGHI